LAARHRSKHFVCATWPHVATADHELSSSPQHTGQRTHAMVDGKGGVCDSGARGFSVAPVGKTLEKSVLFFVSKKKVRALIFTEREGTRVTGAITRRLSGVKKSSGANQTGGGSAGRRRRLHFGFQPSPFQRRLAFQFAFGFALGPAEVWGGGVKGGSKIVPASERAAGSHRRPKKAKASPPHARTHTRTPPKNTTHPSSMDTASRSVALSATSTPPATVRNLSVSVRPPICKCARVGESHRCGEAGGV
jgi:hypothetical protein